MCCLLSAVLLQNRKKTNGEPADQGGQWNGAEYRLKVACKVDVAAVEATKQEPDAAVEQSRKKFQYKRRSYDISNDNKRQSTAKCS